jgi:hypothetical protein
MKKRVSKPESGQVERVEFEYQRHGTQALMANPIIHSAQLSVFTEL